MTRVRLGDEDKLNWWGDHNVSLGTQGGSPRSLNSQQFLASGDQAKTRPRFLE